MIWLNLVLVAMVVVAAAAVMYVDNDNLGIGTFVVMTMRVALIDMMVIPDSYGNVRVQKLGK
jgi:hypothetical protein